MPKPIELNKPSFLGFFPSVKMQAYNNYLSALLTFNALSKRKAQMKKFNVQCIKNSSGELTGIYYQADVTDKAMLVMEALDKEIFMKCKFLWAIYLRDVDDKVYVLHRNYKDWVIIDAFFETEDWVSCSNEELPDGFPPNFW